MKNNKLVFRLEYGIIFCVIAGFGVCMLALWCHHLPSLVIGLFVGGICPLLLGELICYVDKKKFGRSKVWE